jgi:hypothetical protein
MIRFRQIGAVTEACSAPAIKACGGFPNVEAAHVSLNAGLV